MPRCAFLTTDDLTGFVIDDDLARDALRELDWEVESVPWRTASGWSRFDAAIIRTPWDYWNNLEGFLGVLARIDTQTVLQNPLPLVRWNARKTYLRDLQAQGVKIVPTAWRQGFSCDELDVLRAELDAEELIVKPAVSANADRTYRVGPGPVASEVAALGWSGELVLCQPFLPSILSAGETSLIFFDGHFSHAITKTPRTGDFRVQEEHGGIIESVCPEPELVAVAREILAKLEEQPLYARVDFVRGQAGDPLLMELELIEPSLYFRKDEASAARFAQAVSRRLTPPT